ncbi:hypothetical protein LEP1GSC148_3343 [Leptospira interrogans serovar Canicola str. LT1962]|nr:hypothetical protein LEP1GSC148_3343 [Leptospira interrogans serovar Canicola str. LT1962]
MDRRSGLKKAHFSSVPTRMSLFTCKKYVFLIEKNFPNLIASTPPKDRENSATLSYGSRWKTQHNALYESRCGVGTKFYRRFCRNSDRFILRSNTCGVGYGSLNDSCSMSFFTGYGYIITFISSA